MRLRKFDIYIAREVIEPTLLGLGIFTLLLLSGQAIKLAELVINKGVPLSELAVLMFYRMPSYLIFTVPLSFLFGVLLGVGRLSSDSEATALKASGLSLFTLLRPIGVVGLVTAGFTALLTFSVLPHSYTSFRDRLFDLARSRATIGFQSATFNTDFDGLTVYASTVEPNTGQLKQLFIADQRNADSTTLVTAPRGSVLSDKTDRQLILRCLGGEIHRPSPGDSEGYQLIQFSSYDVHLDLQPDTSAAEERGRRTTEMSLSELDSAYARTGDPALMAEYHQRFALPIAPLLLAFVGIPLGLGNQRSGKRAGFSMAILTFLGYYLLLSLVMALAESGILPAWMLVYLPNILFLALGLFLFHRALTEKSTALPIGTAFRRFWRRQ